MTYTGSVDSIFGAASGSNNVFEVGDTISIKLNFDEFQSGSATGTTRRTNSISCFQGIVGTYSFSGTTGEIFLRNDDVGIPFGGNPYDQLNFGFYNESSNNTIFGIDRNDFVQTGGTVGGFPLRDVRIGVQTDDVSMLQNLDLSQAAVDGTFDFLNLYTFRMSFSNETFGSTPLTVSGTFDSATVTEKPIFSDRFEQIPFSC